MIFKITSSIATSTITCIINGLEEVYIAQVPYMARINITERLLSIYILINEPDTAIIRLMFSG